MRNELELDAIIEDYLMGNLNAEEVKAFEQLRQNNPAIDHKVIEHKVFLETLTAYGAENEFRKRLDQIHGTVDVPALVSAYSPKPTLVMKLRRYKTALAVAASFVLATFLSIYVLTTQQSGSYAQVRSELSNIKRSQDNLIRDFRSSKTPALTNPGRYGGTGFALSSNGYLCTNYHVIKDADSIYVQSNKGESYQVEVVFKDQQYDLAILKIVDPRFSKLPHLPYSLKLGDVPLGENVFTLGFSKDDAVLGEGYVSSKSGFSGDTTMAYQVSLPVNPGNSGGPLMDNNGNIVGVITGKQTQVDGAAFAIKSKYVLDALKAIPQDSLNNRIASMKKKVQKPGLKRTKQIEKIQDYVFMVRVF